MKRLFLLTMLLPAFFALQGCVVVIGTDTDDGVYWGSEDRAINGVDHDGDELSRAVARLIARDTDLAHEDIRVTSEDGVVTLKGRVADVHRLARALETARTVTGVERVVSRMAVDAG